jgi:hypothetical protein
MMFLRDLDATRPIGLVRSANCFATFDVNANYAPWYLPNFILIGLFCFGVEFGVEFPGSAGIYLRPQLHRRR